MYDEQIKQYENLVYVSMYYFFKTGDRRVWQRIAKTHNCDVEDLYQIGFITIWKALKKFDEERGDIQNYLISAIKNEIHGELIRLRQQGKRGISDEKRKEIFINSLNVPSNTDEPEELQNVLVGDSDFMSDLLDDLDFRERLKQLSSDEQTIIEYTLQGYKLADVARLTNIPRDTWKYRRSQAVKKLTGGKGNKSRTQGQELFVKLYKEGKSKAYIMECLNINSATSYRTRVMRYRRKGLIT